MYNKWYGAKDSFAIGNLDPITLCGAANLGLMAHSGGNAHRAGGAGSDAVADAGFIIYGFPWISMTTHRNLLFLLGGLALIAASLTCGLGAAQESAAPAPAGEPAVAEPVEEEPAAEESMEDEPPALRLTPTAAVLPDTGGGVEEPQPAISESRRLTLEFPPVMRTGDSTRIRLKLELDDRGNIVPTAVVAGNVVTGEVVEIPNLYETHTVIAEARLDMAGMQVQPGGTISEPLTPGGSVTFYWSVRPEKSGKFEGTAWLHLRFLPKDGGQESRIPVSVQFLEIEATSFLGFLPGSTARGLGALGSILGSVLGFPFIDDFVKWLWRGRRR